MERETRKLIKGKRVALDDDVVPASLIIVDGKITEIKVEYDFDLDRSGNFDEVVDAGDLLLMPGVVDSHVHVNEPGRTEWEGYITATKAAATGGITTIVDMPLNCIPVTTSISAFDTKLREAANKTYVDVAFWGGVVPGNELELRPMINAGICGFKCFLVHSGIDEFPHVTEEVLHRAMIQLQNTNSVLLFHAEVDVSEVPQFDGNDAHVYDTFLRSRPDSMERQAVELVCKLCLQYKVPCHIVHLSSIECLPLVRKAKALGAPLTCETCHHYLSFESENIPPKSTQYKCCPPIRSKENQTTLWKAVKSGDIDMIVSDHSPCTAGLKLLEKGDIMAAWGGISSLQFGLSIFWTNALKQGLTLKDGIRLMCENTAQLAGIHNRKGRIRVGHDADFVIWDPDASYVVTEALIQHRNKVTPYLGMELNGVVHRTIVRGHTVYQEGKLLEKPIGELVLRDVLHTGKL